MTSAGTAGSRGTAMTRRPTVGVISHHVGMEAAARRGFGPRNLSVYAVGTMEKALAHGMVAFGVPAVRGLDAARYCDVLDGLILMPVTECEGRDGRDEPDQRPEGFGLAIATEALKRRLPVLAICRGNHLLTLALAELAGDGVAFAGREPAVTPARQQLSIIDSELREMLGRRVTVTVQHGDGQPSRGPTLRTAVTGPAGTIAAAIGAEQPLLSVAWHPERLPPGDPAGEGPFRWLEQQLVGGQRGEWRRRERSSTGAGRTVAP